MKCTKKLLAAILMMIIVVNLYAVKFKYFVESTSINEAFNKNHAIILKEKYDSLQLNAINNFEVDISAREDFFMEVKPGYHDITVDYLDGNLRRGWFKGNSQTKRHYFRPGNIYLLSSEIFNNRWLLYFKKIDINKLDKDKISIINKMKNVYKNSNISYNNFKALNSPLSRKS